MTALSNGHVPTAEALPARWAAETELNVIGGAMQWPGCLSDALEQLLPEDFSDPRLAVIFGAMAEMHAAGNPVERVALTEYLRRTDRLEAAGREATLQLLDGAIPALGNYKGYVRDVRFAALDRYEAMLAGEIATRSPGEQYEIPREEIRRNLAAVIAARVELETPEPWPLLPSPVLPAFPLEALPDVVARFVEAVAEQTQTPPDLAAFGALGVLSAASLGAVVECGGWEEELSLYLMAVLGTGERKSSALNPVVAPLRKAQKESIVAAKPEIARLKAKIARLESRRASLTKRYGTTEDPELCEELEKQLDELAVEIDKLGEPVAPRLLADDATPEALGRLFAQHGKIAILAAEAPLMDNLIGRYDASGSANLHLVCQAYSGESTSVDRRGRDPELIDRPLLTVALTVQPHVLRNLVEHRVARDQGLVARFAYALPRTRVGKRNQDTPPPVPLEVRKAWEEIVDHVLSLNPLTEQTQPGSVSSVSTSGVGDLRLSLSSSARKLLTALRVEQEPQLADGGELHGVGDWIARHAGRVARIAGLIHLAGVHKGTVISTDTMSRALAIGEYLLAHGRAALEQPDPALRRALEWLETRAERTVTLRDLQRGPLNGRKTREEADQLARRLVSVGALRPLDSTGPGRQGGRPGSPAFAVNPRLWSKEARVVQLRPRDESAGGTLSGGQAA